MYIFCWTIRMSTVLAGEVGDHCGLMSLRGHVHAHMAAADEDLAGRFLGPASRASGGHLHVGGERRKLAASGRWRVGPAASIRVRQNRLRFASFTMGSLELWIGADGQAPRLLRMMIRQTVYDTPARSFRLQNSSDLLHLRRLGVEGFHQDFGLALGFRPVSGFDGLGDGRQFEMRVGVARAVEDVLEPRASGNALGKNEVGFALHEQAD